MIDDDFAGLLVAAFNDPHADPLDLDDHAADGCDQRRVATRGRRTPNVQCVKWATLDQPLVDLRGRYGVPAPAAMSSSAAG